jgi:hypothetical protein
MDETLGKVSAPTKEPCSIYPRVRGSDCGNFQHIFTLPHVTENLIQQLIEDLSQDGAFEEPKKLLRADTEEIATETNALKLAYVPHIGRGFK